MKFYFYDILTLYRGTSHNNNIRRLLPELGCMPGTEKLLFNLIYQFILPAQKRAVKPNDEAIAGGE